MQPASSAGASLDIVVNCGTFHGGIAATTPTGSRRTMTSAPSAPGRTSSHGNSLAMPMNESIIIQGAGDCARLENEVGEPISVVISVGHLAEPGGVEVRERLHDVDALGSGLIRGHGPSSKARRAAATAASMSAAVPSGTRATTSSVCGEITSMQRRCPAGSAQSPPMNRVSRSSVTVVLPWGGQGARVNQSAKPLGSCRPRAPCSKRPQPSAPSHDVRARRRGR